MAIHVQQLVKQFLVPQKKPGFWGGVQSFVHRKYRTVEAVRSISFDVDAGSLVGFLGPNGAGKTTTLKMLSGLLHPTSGEATVLGYVPWKRDTDFLRQFTMIMGQRTQLWWDLPAWDSFLLNKAIYSISDEKFKKTTDELTTLLEIQDLLDVPVKKLSLGQRMKAEFACALLHEPQVLLLDEPTIGLDVVMQQKVRHFIKAYRDKHKATILLTSHNVEDVAELCDRILLINHGQLLFDGALTDLQKKFEATNLSETLRAAFLHE